MRVPKRKAESGKPTCRPALRTSLSAFRSPLSALRRGISLVEILVSIFVLLFGLMGVAAIFPVGNHYVVEGEKFDLGSSLARNAFEEIKARGILRPEFWLYSDSTPGTLNPLIDQTLGTFILPIPSPWDAAPGPGHAFVIDPLGTASAVPVASAVRFPRFTPSSPDNPWGPLYSLTGSGWPVRRITLPQTPGIPLNTAVAETIFRLRDELVVEQPEEDDRPSIQRWNVNGTALLSRQYLGNYSWLATVVPTSDQALRGLQPEDLSYGDYRYDVSVVVFRRREETPSATSERLIQARLEVGGEIALYAVGNSSAEQQIVDAAVDDIRPGNWIAVMGVNQTTGDFLMKWYRLLAMDEESQSENLETSPGNSELVYLRRAMLDGPDWPSNSIFNLRAVLMPGTISVATQQMTMQE